MVPFNTEVCNFRTRFCLVSSLNFTYFKKREVIDTPDLNNEVSRRMGELLLRGHTMLNAECECGVSNRSITYYHRNVSGNPHGRPSRSATMHRL